jgi:zinc transport system ATP-binding protein
MSDFPICIHHVTFGYDASPVLEDVSLDVAANELVCVVGPNGGGKTTLLKLILGLLKPSSGAVRVFGGQPEESRGRVGYVTQYQKFDATFPVRVSDVVLMGRIRSGWPMCRYSRADREAASRALEEVSLSSFAHRPFSSLSGGQRQRVLIARALASEPELLLLDEPTASLDVRFEHELNALLSQLRSRMTVMVVTHDLGFVSSCVQRVVCVNRHVAVHPTSQLTDEAVQALYGGEFRVVRHDQHVAGGGCLHE